MRGRVKAQTYAHFVYYTTYEFPQISRNATFDQKHGFPPRVLPWQILKLAARSIHLRQLSMPTERNNQAKLRNVHLTEQKPPRALLPLQNPRMSTTPCIYTAQSDIEKNGRVHGRAHLSRMREGRGRQRKAEEGRTPKEDYQSTITG